LRLTHSQSALRQTCVCVY